MSKVYFEPCTTNPKNKYSILCSEWHSEYPYYAVSTANGVVTLYNEYGERVEECNMSRSASCTALTWHPSHNMLFTGWKDGVIMVYDDSRGQHSAREVPHDMHSSAAIRTMKWNGDGSRLITVDERGDIGVWVLDANNNNRLRFRARLSCPEQVEHIAFRRSSTALKPETHSESAAQTKSSHLDYVTPNDEHWIFFFGGDKGTIFVADDVGHLKKFIETGSTGLAALVYEERGPHLIFLTETSFLYTYVVRDDLSTEKLQNVKISTSSAAGGVKSQSNLKAIYIGNGVLATCANERFIRIWNLENDENFVLNDPQRHFIHAIENIDFNPRKRAIAAITTDRRLIIWQYAGDSLTSRDQKSLQAQEEVEDTGNGIARIQPVTQVRNSVQGWECYADWQISQTAIGDTSSPTNAADHHFKIEWGPGENIISAYSTNDLLVTIFHETVFQRIMRYGIAIVQTSKDTLRIEKQNSSLNEQDQFVEQHLSRKKQPVTIRCGIKIKQIRATENHIAISNGHKIEIWEMGERIVRSKASLDITSRCIALHNEGLFVVPLLETHAPASSLSREGEQVDADRIEVYTLRGTRKQTISIPMEEGPVADIDIRGDNIAIGTQNNFVQLWQIAGREAKQASASRRIYSQEYKNLQNSLKYHTQSMGRLPSLAISARQISSVRVNSNGTKISVLSRFVRTKSIHEPDTSLLIYNLEQDKEDIYDFRPVLRLPVNHYWDEEEPKLLAVMAQNFASRQASAESSTVSEKSTDMVVSQGKFRICTLFATPDDGVLLQDSFALDQTAHLGLIGISVPFLFYVNKVDAKTEDEQSNRPYIDRQFMRDFQGIEHVANAEANGTDPSLMKNACEALLNFSYHLTIGNMEEAFKSVKMIKDPSVWHNMARMCVKTKRLEVAEICLGNLQDARASMALRETKDEPEIEARIAMLAIQLGLLDEAERLYISCKRYDLLNKMHQSMGEWDKALKVAENHDRIHLRTTHYLYARQLESAGDLMGAIRHFEKSKTHAYEVPRMLYENAHHLERYTKAMVSNYQNFMDQDTSQTATNVPSQSTMVEQHKRKQYLKDCKNIMKWWAQYNEGIGDFDKAFEFYGLAGDHYSLVRMFCFVGKLKEAADIVIQSGDSAAAFRMAIELEKTNQIKPAIEFYMMALSYKHAIRLARQSDLPQEVMKLALQAPPAIAFDAAQYFEEKGQMEKAVLLYQKSGRTSKAIDICFRAQLFDPLLEIAENLSSELEKQLRRGASSQEVSTEGADVENGNGNFNPEMLTRCGDFFMEHGKFEKAAMMYVNSKAFDLVLDLCLHKGVKLTEEMAERIVPTEQIAQMRHMYKNAQEKTRKHIYKVATVAAQQGQYDLATKKFVQLGEKDTAMKVLIKSGNTEKIKFFAKMSRSAELYILAANYLQNLDWHSHSETMKSIIEFYTKAKAWQQLSRFFEACSQVEIDDYRNYDKALDALKEALKHMTKAVNNTKGPSANVSHVQRENMIQLKNRIYLVDKFIMARSLTKNNPPEMIKLCEQLLNELENSADQSVEESVRTGDVYALLIEFHYSQGEMQEAYEHIRRMREKRIPLNYYLDPPMVADICNQLGMQMIIMGMSDDEDEDDNDVYKTDGAQESDNDDEDSVEPSFVKEELLSE